MRKVHHEARTGGIRGIYIVRVGHILEAVPTQPLILSCDKHADPESQQGAEPERRLRVAQSLNRSGTSAGAE